jgi:hypothetical protein
MLAGGGITDNEMFSPAPPHNALTISSSFSSFPVMYVEHVFQVNCSALVTVMTPAGNKDQFGRPDFRTEFAVKR